MVSYHIKEEYIFVSRIFKERNLYFYPDYNNTERWGVQNQNKLLDTIFSLSPGGINTIHLIKTEDKHYEVCDGQHRLKTIFAFLENQIQYKGKFFYELSNSEQDDFTHFAISVKIYPTGTDGPTLYRNINEGVNLPTGTYLLSYPSEFAYLCLDYQHHGVFHKINNHKESNNPELTAYLLTLEIKGITELNHEKIKTMVLDYKDSLPNNTSKSFKNNIEILNKSLSGLNNVTRYVFLDLYLFISKDRLSYNQSTTEDLKQLILLLTQLRKEVKNSNFYNPSDFTHELVTYYNKSHKRGLNRSDISQRNEVLNHLYEEHIKKKN